MEEKEKENARNREWRERIQNRGYFEKRRKKGKQRDNGIENDRKKAKQRKRRWREKITGERRRNIEWQK